MNKAVSYTQLTDGPTWRDLVQRASLVLATPNEARWIAEAVANRLPAADFSNELPTQSDLVQFSRMVERRRSGEPLQHVLGHWPFRSVDLLVDRRALVPRPETEIVVDAVLAILDSSTRSPLVVDLGTGSGAIACSLVTEHPSATVIATDVSDDALALAADNRDRLQASARQRLELRHGDFYAAVPAEVQGRVACVVANPPYVTDAEWEALAPVVRDFDPRVALVSGPSGTEAIEKVVRGAPNVLMRGGSAVVEFSPLQTAVVERIARLAGASSIEVHRDLSGRDRVLVARW